MAGDVTKRLDPYFPFERSVEQRGPNPNPNPNP